MLAWGDGSVPINRPEPPKIEQREPIERRGRIGKVADVLELEPPRNHGCRPVPTLNVRLAVLAVVTSPRSTEVTPIGIDI